MSKWGWGILLIRVLEGGNHEWKGWEVVSLSTHADGYLSRLINDAYVDRLCLLPVVRKARSASSETGD